MIRNNCELKYVRDKYKNRELLELQKMYPKKMYELAKKYVLFLQCELWFPFYTEEIQAIVELKSKTDLKNFKTRLRTPYPNKSITMISLVNGRKVCNMGIPVIFDSFKEMTSYDSFSVRWSIKALDQKKKCKNFYIQAQYNLIYDYIKNKNIYGVFTKDTIFQSYNNGEEKEKYVNQFDEVIVIRNYSEDKFSIDYVKGKENDSEKLEEKGFTILMENLGTRDFLNAVKNSKDDYTIFYYKSDEILKPDTVAHDLPHIL